MNVINKIIQTNTIFASLVLKCSNLIKNKDIVYSILSIKYYEYYAGTVMKKDIDHSLTDELRLPEAAVKSLIVEL